MMNGERRFIYYGHSLTFIYYEILFRYEKEEHLVICTLCVDVDGIILNEKSQTEKTSTAYHLQVKSMKSQIHRSRD